MKQHQLTHKIRDGGSGNNSMDGSPPGPNNPHIPPTSSSASSSPIPVSAAFGNNDSSSPLMNPEDEPASPNSSIGVAANTEESIGGGGVKRAPSDSDIMSPLPKRLHGKSNYLLTFQKKNPSY